MAIELNINDSELTRLLELSINTHLEAKFNDENFLNKLGSLINQAVSNRLNTLDLSELVDEKIKEHFSGSIINKSKLPQLTITDEYVVNENEFITNNLSVEKDLVIKGNLSLRGRVNVDNSSWDELKKSISTAVLAQVNRSNADFLIQRVKTSILNEGIEIESAQYQGEPIINNNTLNSQITESNIKKLGTLRELDVKGAVSLNNETLNVLNTRVGINTEKPTMALELWDQEVQISLGKIQKDTGFIGRADKGVLHIGVNQGDEIRITEDGVVRINNLKIGRNSIIWASGPPGHAGITGDIVFSTSKNITGWKCIGGHNWSQF